MDAHDQDSTRSNVVSPPTLGFEGRWRLSVEKKSKHLPQLIGEGDVPGDGPSWSPEGRASFDKAFINALLGVPARTLHTKQLTIACLECRRRKIGCDLAKPKCRNCARLGLECGSYGPILGPRVSGDGSLNLTEEVRKHEQARFLKSDQSLNDDDPTVYSLAYSLPLSPQNRKSWPERYPQHAAHSKLKDGLSSGTALQALRTYGVTPIHVIEYLWQEGLLTTAEYRKLKPIANAQDVPSPPPLLDDEDPIQPLAEIHRRHYAKPLKVRLAIPRMIRDRILHPTVQGKPHNRAVDALRLTRRSKLDCPDIQQTLRGIAIYSLPLILARYSDKIPRVWLEDSIFKDGTFSRPLDLQDRHYPLEADHRESCAQGFSFAPRSTCPGSRTHKMLLAFHLRQ